MKQVGKGKIFCSYAHEDQLFAHELKKHFAPLVRLYPWVFWSDMEIRAGEEWERAIQEQLDTAQIILLLVSPSFMDSEYCYGKEMKRAMERHGFIYSNIVLQQLIEHPRCRESVAGSCLLDSLDRQ